MGFDNTPQALAQLRQTLHVVQGNTHQPIIDRIISNIDAARFHYQRQPSDQPVVAIIGGTGTGKSTLINRLLNRPDGQEISATSFRRTFTAGMVALTDNRPIPDGWGDMPHINATTLPARGEIGRITKASLEHPLLQQITLIDTPDIDGELTDHHQQAERAFWWADAVIFLVTPEKYQMTELPPFYRLAERYNIPALFAMNKIDEQGAVDDYTQLLTKNGFTQPKPFTLPRDDSTYASPEGLGLDALRNALLSIHISDLNLRINGLNQRTHDIASRVQDQILSPLRTERQKIDRMVDQLHTLRGTGTDLDVLPLTKQLQRRLREKSVLYLIGPQRMLDRLQSVPSALVRFPRNIWDLARTGKTTRPAPTTTAPTNAMDFRSILIEQFQSLQSRIDDILQPLEQTDAPWKLPVEQAGLIADEEINHLKQWLETKWNATPRDTAMLQKLLKIIPGGTRLTQYSEAAPYLLTVVCAAKGAVFGHVDLMILGGYSVFTWLTEKATNEVSLQTRNSNTTIAKRFQSLLTEQIEKAIQHLTTQAPTSDALNNIEQKLEEITPE